MRCLQEIHNAARVILISRRRLGDADDNGKLHATMPEKCRATLHQKVVGALLCRAGAGQRRAGCHTQCANFAVRMLEYDKKTTTRNSARRSMSKSKKAVQRGVSGSPSGSIGCGAVRADAAISRT